MPRSVSLRENERGPHILAGTHLVQLSQHGQVGQKLQVLVEETEPLQEASVHCPAVIQHQLRHWHIPAGLPSPKTGRPEVKADTARTCPSWFPTPPHTLWLQDQPPTCSVLLVLHVAAWATIPPPHPPGLGQSGALPLATAHRDQVCGSCSSQLWLPTCA